MSDDDDFVFFGKPIEREEEVTTGKKKAVAEASGQLRTALAPWKQEVRDEEGRRRFHGAFTGGYSAGYYNTVGSKEGWTPQTFTSSRKNRAEVKEQNIYNFLDEDEKSDLEDRSLAISMKFDIFGSTAAELAHKQAEKEQQLRPSAIPGPVPDELLVPTTDSIGVKLLLKMGWRQGRSIKNSSRNSLNDAKREARKAFLALSSDQLLRSQLDDEDDKNFPDHPTDNDERFIKSTPAYVLVPKQDLYGLGFDPFKQAPEFREKKRQRTSGHGDMGRNMSLSLKSKVGPGFGIGALEDLDAEDEDVYSAGHDFQHTYVQEIEEPSIVNAEVLRISDGGKQRDTLPGFEVASNLEDRFERFDPPLIPEDFIPHHKFPAPLGNNGKISEIAPPEVPPPEDNNLKIMIEGVATLVARCGKLFEDLSREKNQSNPLFNFLHGGTGSDFYERKLWEELQKRGGQSKLWEGKKSQNSEKLTAEGRGKILGEKALESSSKSSSSLPDSAAAVTVQFHLSDTFTKPASSSGQPDVSKPFSHDPEKQQRYEQFLKEKYEGGLRTKDSGGFSNISESARARERLEFESAAENNRLGKESKDTNQLLAELTGSAALQFTAGGMENVRKDEELALKAMYPKREEFHWRPSPILCKRFDIIDPYMGKPPPAPRVKTKIDSLFFMPDSVKPASVEEHPTPSSALKGKQGIETSEKEEDTDPVEVENVERPIDLYKAIFSDSEDEEENNTKSNPVEDNTKKKTEVVNTTLNRLIAGDFLESLGKELGLEVPPELCQSKNKANEFPQQKSDSTNLGTAISTNGERTENNTDEKMNLERDKHRDESSPEKRNSRKHSNRRKHKSSRRKNSYSSADSETSSDNNDYRDRKRSRSKRRKEKGDRHHRSSKHKKNDYSSNQRRSGEYDEDRKRKKHRYDD